MDNSNAKIDSPRQHSTWPWLKWIHTGNILVALLALGSITAVTGTSFDQLGSIFGYPSETVSSILVSRSAGTLVASLICGGFVFHRYNAKVIIIVALIIGGIGTGIVPDINSLFFAHVGFFLTGASIGALEIGGNVWLVQLWEDKVSPFLQAYHLCFGIGSFFAPMLSAPFLNSANENNASSTGLVVLFDNDLAAPSNGTSEVWIPYAIFGSAYSLVGVLMLIFYLYDRSPLLQNAPDTVEESTSRTQLKFDWTIVILLSIYLVIDVTIEATMAQMLDLYVKSNPSFHISSHMSPYVVALFWGMYTIGRTISIFVSLRVTPNVFLVISQVITTSGALLLLILVFDPSQGSWVIWAGTAVIGFGLSPAYGTVFAWGVRYIHLKFSHMGLIMVASCAGMAIPSFIIAPTVKSSLHVFPVTIVCLAASEICLLVIMLSTTKGRTPIYEKTKSNTSNDELVERL